MELKKVFCPKLKGYPLVLLTESSFKAYFKRQKSTIKSRLDAQGFKGSSGQFSLLFKASGELEQVLIGCGSKVSRWSLGNLPMTLPEGDYHIADLEGLYEGIELELGWGLGAYQFSRYKKPKRNPARLCIRQNSNFIHHLVESIYWVRDLINTPTEDMTPEILASEAKSLEKYGAKYQVIVGDDLLKENFPVIHRVGRAAQISGSEPRLVELTWGDPKAPKISLVGKGVCFDTGGLDLKPSNSMRLMKKDMGGAAQVLGLAKLIMAENLPIYLQILIPAVENSISGSAMRPSDIIKSRKGLTIEIGNTDAEGRLILADALAYACEGKPDLVLDFATLTGAHHVALGPAIPAILSKDKNLRRAIEEHSEQEEDLVWPLPMYQEYRSYIDSQFADLNNNSRMPYAGCITAALFLSEFVDLKAWAHFDLMAYNVENLPGRPIGGDAQALRAVFAYLKNNWQKNFK